MGCCQISFFYNPIKNIFIDADGFVVYEIFRLVSPGQLMLFKKNKKDMTIQYKKNTIKLYWSNSNGLCLNHRDETIKLGDNADNIEQLERYEKGKWYINY